MNTLTAISLIVIIVIADILAFTKYKDLFTYEVEETLLIDDNGKAIKILDSKRIKK